MLTVTLRPVDSHRARLHRFAWRRPLRLGLWGGLGAVAGWGVALSGGLAATLSGLLLAVGIAAITVWRDRAPRLRSQGTGRPLELELRPDRLVLDFAEVPWAAVGQGQVVGDTVLLTAGPEALAWQHDEAGAAALAAVRAHDRSASWDLTPPPGRDALFVPLRIDPTMSARTLGLILPVVLGFLATRPNTSEATARTLWMFLPLVLAATTHFLWAPWLRGVAYAWAGPDGWWVRMGQMAHTGTWTEAPLGRAGRAVELGVAVVPLRRVGSDRLAQLHAWSAAAQDPWAVDDLD